MIDRHSSASVVWLVTKAITADDKSDIEGPLGGAPVPLGVEEGVLSVRTVLNPDAGSPPFPDKLRSVSARYTRI